MAETGKKVEVRFGAFSCSVEGYDDPVERMREILMLMQQMIRETPALSDQGSGFGEDELARIESALDQREEARDGASPGIVVIRAGGRDRREEPEDAVTTDELPPSGAFAATIPDGGSVVAGAAPVRPEPAAGEEPLTTEPERPLDDETAEEPTVAAIFSAPAAEVAEKAFSPDITGPDEAGTNAGDAPSDEMSKRVAADDSDPATQTAGADEPASSPGTGFPEMATESEGAETAAEESAPTAPGAEGVTEAETLAPAAGAGRPAGGADDAETSEANAWDRLPAEAIQFRNASARGPEAAEPTEPEAEIPSGDPAEAPVDEVAGTGAADPWTSVWGAARASGTTTDQPAGEPADADTSPAADLPAATRAAGEEDEQPGVAVADETDRDASHGEPADAEIEAACATLRDDDASHPALSHDGIGQDAPPAETASTAGAEQRPETDAERPTAAAGEPGNGEASDDADRAAAPEAPGDEPRAALNIFAPPPEPNAGAADIVNIFAPPAQDSDRAAPAVNIFASPVPERPAATGPFVPRRATVASSDATALNIFASPGAAQPSADVMLDDPPAPASGETAPAEPDQYGNDGADEASPGDATSASVRSIPTDGPDADDEPDDGAEEESSEPAEDPALWDADGGSTGSRLDVSARRSAEDGERTGLADDIDPVPQMTVPEPAAADPLDGRSADIGEYRGRFSSLLARLGGRRTSEPAPGHETARATGTATIGADADPGDLARRAGAESVSDLLAVSAAWLTLIEDKPRFTRRQVMEVFERLPGDHPRTLEARIKAFGKLVRSSTLILVDDGVFALAQTERERFQAMIEAD